MNNLKRISSTVILSLILIVDVSAVENTKDIKIEIDGKSIVSDVAPFIDNNRTLVPIRVISENLGYSVNWDNQARKVTVKNNDKSIELVIGKKYVKVNGTKSSIDVAPMIKNERTFVPLRFISESFDNDVSWDNNTRTVKINKKDTKVASIFNDSNIKSAYKSITPITPQPKAQQVDDNNYIKPYYLNKFIYSNVPHSSMSYIYKPQDSFSSSYNKSDSLDKFITTEDLNFKKYKSEQIEHVERLLKQIDIDQRNMSTLNYNKEAEHIAIQKLQEELRLIKEPKTIEDKIHLLKINYDLTQKQDQMKFQIEFNKFSDQSYFNFLKCSSKLKENKDKAEFFTRLNECESQFKTYKTEYYKRVLNDRLSSFIKERNYIKDTIDLLNLDNTNNNKDQIFELNKRLINLDSQIMYAKNAETEYEKYPEVQKLLDEYEKSVKKDIENYHKPQNQENNKADTSTSSNDNVLKELTKNLRLFYYIFPANTPSGLYSYAEVQNDSNYTIKEMSLELILDNGKPFHYVLNGSLAPNKKEKLLPSNNMNKNLTGMTVDRMYQSKVSEFYAVVVLPSGEETSVGFMNENANSSWIFGE
ncbi:MAG: copper amine oxidase N-terminal domain-containing protein [Peptoniphilus harei]|nr:copper amine oxidase N-terminal domain-containing protein [Peptoniphilus harei]